MPDFPPLAEGLIQLGLENRDGKILPLLARYIEEIELFNPAYGLVKVRDRRELVVKHILDSLAPLNLLRPLLNPSPRPLIADVGSGAGLPGIPLAVCMPGADFVLIERMGRRAGFLRNALAVLGLPNVRVEEKEMEKFPLKATEQGPFDMVVFRAYRPLSPVMLRGLFRLLSPRGILAAYKGRRESVEEEMASLSFINNWEALPLKVPFLDEERHLVLIRP